VRGAGIIRKLESKNEGFTDEVVAHVVKCGNGDICHSKLISQSMAYVMSISIMGKMGMCGVFFFTTICHKL
jgi:hypothetical protein